MQVKSGRGEKRKMSGIDARTKAIGIISGGRVQALEDAGLMIVDKQEIDKLKEKLNAVLQDFYQYVQGGKEICAFCLHDYECEPGETICGATYKGFKWRGLNDGKWTHGINENFRTCSACNISMGLSEGENLSRFKYCPFCGAKMEVTP